MRMLEGKLEYCKYDKSWKIDNKKLDSMLYDYTNSKVKIIINELPRTEHCSICENLFYLEELTKCDECSKMICFNCFDNNITYNHDHNECLCNDCK
ncbi:hypothetical protein [Clostridium botulinum]|uniref:hypothetical protein n=1 Tax=Clostridium botulinum TaxID=1491 RepID=UPI001C9B80D9|nr:hypothetical protein [Clostridium botulinum]MBY6838765.1 hypothetical protein [Clostridium botulinum]